MVVCFEKQPFWKERKKDTWQPSIPLDHQRPLVEFISDSFYSSTHVLHDLIMAVASVQRFGVFSNQVDVNGRKGVVVEQHGPYRYSFLAECSRQMGERGFNMFSLLGIRRAYSDVS